jgi:hypothetical protein
MVVQELHLVFLEHLQLTLEVAVAERMVLVALEQDALRVLAVLEVAEVAGQ